MPRGRRPAVRSLAKGVGIGVGARVASPRPRTTGSKAPAWQSGGAGIGSSALGTVGGMNTTTSIFLVGIIVCLGRWAQKKDINIRIVVGIGVAAILLAVLDAANDRLARAFGTVMVVAALFVPVGSDQPYIVAIVNSLKNVKPTLGAAPGAGGGDGGDGAGGSNPLGGVAGALGALGHAGASAASGAARGARAGAGLLTGNPAAAAAGIAGALKSGGLVDKAKNAAKSVGKSIGKFLGKPFGF